MTQFFPTLPILILLSPSENTLSSAAISCAPSRFAILSARSGEAGPAITDISGNVSDR
jgi:hypothetical protein